MGNKENWGKIKMDVRNFRTKILTTHKSSELAQMHVVVLMGGMSAEREVSMSSGKGVVNALIEMDYNVTALDMGFDVSEYLLKIKPDVVYNSLHGPFGEDGCVPGMLEILGIPYTHSGVLASAIALDKIGSQMIFMMDGIKCPTRKIVYKDNNFIKDPFPRPYIIKPVHEGSSIGVVPVFEGDDYSMLDYDFAYGDIAIVEEFIVGREIQVAVVQGKAIGTLEIVPLQRRIYDYDTKYVEGMAEHLYPAPLSEENTKKVLSISERAHKLLGCKGATRVEFRFNEQENEFYFLELNTHPGFTPLSIVPEIARNNGVSFNQLVQLLIDEAINVREKV